MKVENHLLMEEGIKVLDSPNQRGELRPDTIIIHYTAGPSAQSAINTFLDPASKASAHLIIDLDGSITQMVPFNKRAWHAGSSRHVDKSQNINRSGLNQYSIGIEIVNAGRLRKSGKSFFSWFEKAYSPEDVVKAPHRNEDSATYWHRYTEKQISIVDEICKVIVQEYGIKYILGHEEISPGRKIDPGPAFPLDKMRNRILALHPRAAEKHEEKVDIPSEGRVTASKLNIRSGSSVISPQIANPLPKGTKVKILEKFEGWYRVSVNIEGWVSGDFIRPD